MRVRTQPLPRRHAPQRTSLAITKFPISDPALTRYDSFQGFKTSVREGVELAVDSRVRLDFTLDVGDASSSVSVVGEAPLVDSESPSLGQLLTTRTVESLPIKGRNVFDLSLLSPGVTVNPARLAESHQPGTIRRRCSCSPTSPSTEVGTEPTTSCLTESASCCRKTITLRYRRPRTERRK